MSSHMQRQFVPYAILCRLGGCFFIQNFWKPLENAKVTWRSLYTVYSAFLIAWNFSFDIVLIVQESYVFRDLSQAFSPSLILVLRMVVTSKILLSAGAMATGSGGLLEFFKKSSMYEKITGFSPARRGFRALWRNRWSFFRRLLVLIGLISTYIISMLPFMYSLGEQLPPSFSFLGQMSAVLGAACYLLYDALPYMVLRSCSTVLEEYLDDQLKTFRRCCGFKPSRNERKLSEQLEAIRHNMAKIRDLKDSLNAIGQVPLATTSAGILIVDCVVCYAMFNDGFFATDVPLALSYCVFSSFAFVDLAFASQALTDEARKLSNATKVAITFGASEKYVQELRYLHKTIDPDGMCLSGGGFFRLNKPLLLTLLTNIMLAEDNFSRRVAYVQKMAGAILSYIVILSQTSEGLKDKAGPK